jgi:hypothetical protein
MAPWIVFAFSSSLDDGEPKKESLERNHRSIISFPSFNNNESKCGAVNCKIAEKHMKTERIHRTMDRLRADDDEEDDDMMQNDCWLQQLLSYCYALYRYA